MPNVKELDSSLHYVSAAKAKPPTETDTTALNTRERDKESPI